MTEKAKSYCEKFFGAKGLGLAETDPEFSDFSRTLRLMRW